MTEEASSKVIRDPPSLVPESLQIPITKSLHSLSEDDIDNEEESKRDGYLEIYQALGLSGDDSEQINLTRFRRIISDNLDIDESFMFKRVFNAFEGNKLGYLTAKEVVSAISVLLQGPFQAQVELGLRVYGKPANDKPDIDKCKETPFEPADFKITKMDAILSIVESLQMSSSHARRTLSTNNREKAYQIGEDLVILIFPKLDIDGDGVISLQDFSLACHDDPSLIQVFGQYLPRNTGVLPSPLPSSRPPSRQVVVQGCSNENNEDASQNRPVRSCSSCSSFEGIDYLKHSPLIGTMWGRQAPAAVAGDGTEGSIQLKKSEKLEPIPIIAEPE